MKTFEDCLTFIENELGIYLLAWQKEALRAIYEDRPYYYRPARGIGMTTLDKAVVLLAEFTKENENASGIYKSFNR